MSALPLVSPRSAPAADSRLADPRAVKVMVVDDSVVVRSAVARVLRSDPLIEVVATAADPVGALETLARTPADVILLDVEMPRMSGLEAIPHLRRAAPDAKIVMLSSLTNAGAETSLAALAAGATETIGKPSAGDGGVGGAGDFPRRLLAIVKGLGRAPRLAASAAAAPVRLAPRREDRGPPAALVLGCSTGGPQALSALLGQFARAPAVPMLIVQHMPATFTRILADRLAKQTGFAISEAEDGQPVLPGRILLAPGDRHLGLARNGTEVTVRLDDGPPEQFCRPAVDVLFRDAARVWGAQVLGAILTGMGQDGLNGTRAIVAAGGSVIVQDAASSVVWGMPGAVAGAGLAAEVLPLAQFGDGLTRRLGRKGG